MTMSTSVHEQAARAIIRLSPSASVADQREVLEALGIVNPGEHELAPDRKCGPPRQPIKHGSPGGYRAHLRHGPEPCRPCRDAECERTRKAKARKKERLEQAQVDYQGSPIDQVHEVIDNLTHWVSTVRVSKDPAVQDATTSVTATLVRLQLAVGQLERSLHTVQREKRSA